MLCVNLPRWGLKLRRAPDAAHRHAACKFTPLGFETYAIPTVLHTFYKWKFTPLGFETTPLGFETYGFQTCGNLPRWGLKR